MFIDKRNEFIARLRSEEGYGITNTTNYKEENIEGQGNFEKHQSEARKKFIDSITVK